MKEIFTINDLAAMTMLSTRTLRNYIKQGFLTGEKVNGVWNFTAKDIDSFLKNRFINQNIQSKKNSIVYDYMAEDVKKENMVCSVYDYPGIEKEEAESIRNRILQLVNSDPYGSITFSYTYKGKTKMVRIILAGTTAGIHTLMNDFNRTANKSV